MRFATVLVALTLLGTPFFAHAQALGECAAVSRDVTMELNSDLASTVPSASVGIYASVQNDSSATLDGHVLAVDVVRESDGAIVGRFLAPQRVTAFAQSPAKVGFVWEVPAAIESGDYTVTATLAPQTASRARVFGHVGYPTATMTISVSDGRDAAPTIRSTQINSIAYESWSVADIPVGSVSAVVAVANRLRSPYYGAMEWHVYAADASLSDEPLSSETIPLALHASSTEEVLYQLPHTDAPALYIEGVLVEKDALAYVDILLDRGGDTFAWADCVPKRVPSDKETPQGVTYTLFAGLAVIVALGLWMEMRRGWRFSSRS